MTEEGQIYMVDGPDDLILGAPLGKVVVRAWGVSTAPTGTDGCLLNRIVLRDAAAGDCGALACDTDADCPWTRESHSCKGAGSCEPRARGAPESRGQCSASVCTRLSERTHVFDVATRPWLLPYIADQATGPERDFLRGLIRLAGSGQVEDRPSFAELVDRVDEFIRQPTRVAPSPKGIIYASDVIQRNARRRRGFWDYASVFFMDMDPASGARVRAAIRALCADRGLACWEAQVAGRGQDLPAPMDLSLLRGTAWKARHRRDVRSIQISAQAPQEPAPARPRPVAGGPPGPGRARRGIWQLPVRRGADAPGAAAPDLRFHGRRGRVECGAAVLRREHAARRVPRSHVSPWGVQDKALRLAGVLKGDRAITRSECDRAVDNLDAFELITESVGAVATLLYGFYDLAAPTVAPPPADRAFPTSPAAKARVLDASWCHARIVAAARKLPSFV